MMNIRREVEARLKGFPLYSQEKLADPIVHCKLFHAYGSATWYLTEFDGQDIAFGYVTGMVADEWGYVAISELEALRIAKTIPRIECDVHFRPIIFSKLRIQEGF
ncbi:DUF2958 domain-containing protein [Parasphingorhabdus halotolerans]|uniref:DUF2958 domain-containing protein n=1 Tax=Parasphingorhabdus halotolerans TaxID=2725558 RepID=A0A6H2DMG6_9SPHN|nr:DUF2958 domain-containing protein [Parasphingorhabdus halotolerans]QJB69859.1 DUF2958 domain-containing protein [Parasphingorhabdus halotolerans]